MELESLKEIPQLLGDEVRADVQNAIIQYLLGLYHLHTFHAIINDFIFIAALIKRNIFLTENLRFDWI